MKKVLITGATGFIGRHSLPVLVERGFEVHAVTFGSETQTQSQTLTPAQSQGPSQSRVSSRPAWAPDTVIWHEADLLQKDQMENLMAKVKPGHLLHFAWYVEHGKYLNSPENQKWVEASVRLTDSFIRNGGRRFVCAGTCFEYDWSQGHCAENSTPLKPRGLYGAAKNQFHQYLQKAAKAGLESYAWGRIFFLYGPDEPPRRLIPAVASALKENRPLPPIFSKRARDFMHVEDVGSAFACLLDSEVNGPVNIASGHTHTLGEIVFTIADVLGKPRPELTEPAVTANNAASGEPEILSAEVHRLHDELHWSPRYTLREGLEKILK